MRRAIRIGIPGDGRRVNLNFTAGGFQRVRLRIGPEGGKAGKACVCGLRYFYQLIILPELGERRQRNLLLRPTLGGNLVKRLQPLQIALPGSAPARPLPSAR